MLLRCLLQQCELVLAEFPQSRKFKNEVIVKKRYFRKDEKEELLLFIKISKMKKGIDSKETNTFFLAGLPPA